jgi:DNA-binding beta-propeller fold protein YncE
VHVTWQSLCTLKWSVVTVTLLAGGCDRPPLTPNGVIGTFGTRGLGPGAFVYPRAITVGRDNAIYVVDKSARIQRFSPEGDFETVWNMPERRAGKPVGLWAGPNGRIYVADTHYHRVIVYDRDGKELARFGRKGTGDGEFQLPTDVVVDREGFIYVSEYNGNDRITKWSPDYAFHSVLAAGEVAGKRLNRPAAMDIDDDDTLWVADACNHRILRFDLQGRLLACFGELGDGPGQLRYPYDIAVTGQDTIMVCEFENCRLQWFTKDGTPVRTWGTKGRQVGELSFPWGAAVGHNGNVCIVDSLNSRVQIVRP